MPQQRQPPTVNGPVHHVPCPHCGRRNDLRELDSQNLLDTGSEIICSPVDGAPNTGHCGRLFAVVGIRAVKFVVVAPLHKPARAGLPAAQPARAVAPGLLQRLLGKGQ
jgi:hypothetical protein